MFKSRQLHLCSRAACVAAAVVSAALGLSHAPARADVTFQTVMEDAQAHQSGTTFSGPSINNSGVVAFIHSRVLEDLSGPPRQIIYAWSERALITIADNSSRTFSVFSRILSINNKGVVAFDAARTGGGGIYTGSGGALTTIADETALFEGFGSKSINDRGVVAFSYNRDEIGRDTVVLGIYTGSGGALTTIADSDTPTLASLSRGTSINNRGVVAFKAKRDAGGEAIYTGSGGPITTIVDSDSPTFSTFNNPVINNNGVVAFRANRDAGGSGIYTVSGGITTTIADTDSPTFSGFRGHSLNNKGAIAFPADLDSGGFGIYLSDGKGGFITVLQTGDSFMGSTVSNCGVGTNGLNDKNQLAIWVKLADGREGIYRADDSLKKTEP